MHGLPAGALPDRAGQFERRQEIMRYEWVVARILSLLPAFVSGGPLHGIGAGVPGAGGDVADGAGDPESDFGRGHGCRMKLLVDVAIYGRNPSKIIWSA